MEPAVIVAMGALSVSVATVILTGITMRRSAQRDQVEANVRRLNDHEQRLRDCEDARKMLKIDVDRLTRENVELMRQLVARREM